MPEIDYEALPQFGSVIQYLDENCNGLDNPTVRAASQGLGYLQMCHLISQLAPLHDLLLYRIFTELNVEAQNAFEALFPADHRFRGSNGFKSCSDLFEQMADFVLPRFDREEFPEAVVRIRSEAYRETPVWQHPAIAMLGEEDGDVYLPELAALLAWSRIGPETFRFLSVALSGQITEQAREYFEHMAQLLETVDQEVVEGVELGYTDSGIRDAKVTMTRFLVADRHYWRALAEGLDYLAPFDRRLEAEVDMSEFGFVGPDRSTPDLGL